MTNKQVKDKRKGHDHTPIACGYVHGTCEECGRNSCAKLSKRVYYEDDGSEADVCNTCVAHLKKKERMRS